MRKLCGILATMHRSEKPFFLLIGGLPFKKSGGEIDLNEQYEI